MGNQESKNNVNPIKEGLRELTRNRVKQYKEQEEQMKELLRKNSAHPLEERERDKKLVLEEAAQLEKIYQEIFPYIRKAHSHISEITNQDTNTAVYLLFGKVSQGLQAMLVLAREGFHYEVMELIRSNREALDLISLFLSSDDATSLLKKWFDSDVIENKESRKAIDTFINKEFLKKEGFSKPVEETKSGIYAALSKYSHISYAALLDSFDVFRRDFDFDRVAGFHYLRTSSLDFLREGLASTMIALKHFYLSVRDAQSWLEVDSILEKYGLVQGGNLELRKQVRETLKRYQNKTRDNTP